MLSSLAVHAARVTPPFVKRWVHRHGTIYRWCRHSFAALVGMGGGTVSVESGPAAGLRLAVSQHVSHAHIRGTYEPDSLLAIDRFVRPGDVCYDLGASIGYLTLLMARRARHVYAFEPSPVAAEEMRKHVAANRFSNITIVPQPVSDSRQVVEFGISDTAFDSYIGGGRGTWPMLTLTTVTLDEFTETHPPPDFLKIDVEGEEVNVLRGARKILETKRSIIWCELHSAELGRDVLAILSEYGYRVTTLSGEGFQVTGPIVPGEIQVLALPESLSR
jgi:FkbM family methyltransferase